MTDKNTDNTEYTATFTLRQTGKEGDVFSTLVFEPRISAADPSFPLVYEMMSELNCEYLYWAGLIDAKGNLTDEETFHKLTQVNVTPMSSGSIN